MQRLPVKSSTIVSIGYSEGVLEIEFKRNAVYQYLEVPNEIFVGLRDAISAGKYFDQKIKGRFKTIKL